MSLMRYLREVTHKEHLVWVAHLEEQWNEPDRSDHYLMQIAAEVRRGNVKNPGSVKDEHLKIRFRKQVVRPSDPNVIESSKGAWVALVSSSGERPLPITHVTGEASSGPDVDGGEASGGRQ